MHSDKNQKVAVWKCVMRGNEMEVLKRVTKTFQSPGERTRTSKANTIFGFYVFEYLHNALCAGRRACAAGFNHAIMPPDVNAFLQNGLAKTPADLNYPISDNQRVKARQDNETPVSCPQEPLLMLRAKNILSSVMDADNDI